MKERSDCKNSKVQLASLRKLFLQLDKKLATTSAFSSSRKEERFAFITLLTCAQLILSDLKDQQTAAVFMCELLQSMKVCYGGENPFFSNSDPSFQSRADISANALHKLIQENMDLLCVYSFICPGYFYQWMCEQNRRDALKRVQQADKQSSRDDLIHFTQLYTPSWISNYLLQQTTRAWMANSSEHTLESIRVLDPACGGGHILVRAFDFLITQTAVIAGASRSVKQILNHNLSGCDIDGGALWTCALALIAQATAHLRKEGMAFPSNEVHLRLFNVSNSESHDQLEIGSLARDFAAGHPLKDGADLVIANPPYIGRRLMDRRLKSFLRENYPDSQHDLSAAFIERAMELAKPSGYVGFITQASLLFLPSYEKLRKKWLADGSVESIVELGTGTFPLQSGEKINSMLIVLRSGQGRRHETDRKMRFLDLRKSENKEADLSKPFSVRSCSDFVSQRASALNYRCPRSLSTFFARCRKLSEVTDIKQGLATSDNQRFLRYWWQVPKAELNVRWHPYVKGAGSERWSAPIEAVIDWGKDGKEIKQAVGENYPYLEGKISWVVKNEQYYFREGLTFSFVNTGQFAVRKMPAGCIFDVGGSCLFPFETSQNFLLGYLNSSFIAYCAELLNPTFNCQVGDIKQLPYLSFSGSDFFRMESLAAEALKLKLELDRFRESSFSFKAPCEIDKVIIEREDPDQTLQEILKADKVRRQRLNEIEAEIDQLILTVLRDSKEINKEDLREIESQLSCLTKRRQIEELNSRFFAGLILRECIRRLFTSSAAGNELKGQLTLDLQSVINEAFDETRGQTEIARALGIAPNLVLWLGKTLEMNLVDWLKANFNVSQMQIFRSSPQIILLPSQKDGEFIFVSAAKLKAAQTN